MSLFKNVLGSMLIIAVVSAAFLYIYNNIKTEAEDFNIDNDKLKSEC